MADQLSDTHIAAPHESHVNPKGNVSPDDPEEDPKAMWRPCPKCKALPEDGQFRLINIRWGIRQSCRVCVGEEREAVERSRFQFTSRNVEKQADAFLKAHGAKLSWKRGGKQLK